MFGGLLRLPEALIDLAHPQVLGGQIDDLVGADLSEGTVPAERFLGPFRFIEEFRTQVTLVGLGLYEIGGIEGQPEFFGMGLLDFRERFRGVSAGPWP